jgi:hypothetical protein
MLVRQFKNHVQNVLVLIKCASFLDVTVICRREIVT